MREERHNKAPRPCRSVRRGRPLQKVMLNLFHEFLKGERDRGAPIRIAVYCGATQAAVIDTTLPANGELHVNTDVSLTAPCHDTALLVLNRDTGQYIAAPALG